MSFDVSFGGIKRAFPPANLADHKVTLRCPHRSQSNVCLSSSKINDILTCSQLKVNGWKRLTQLRKRRSDNQRSDILGRGNTHLSGRSDIASYCSPFNGQHRFVRLLGLFKDGPSRICESVPIRTSSE